MTMNEGETMLKKLFAILGSGCIVTVLLIGCGALQVKAVYWLAACGRLRSQMLEERCGLLLGVVNG